VIRLQEWFAEDPSRTPAEYALALARDRFWRDETGRLVRAHPDFPDVTFLLGLGEDVAHALVLALSRLPLVERAGFAATFFAERRLGHDADAAPDFHARLALASPTRSIDARSALTAGAAFALGVVDLAATPALRDERVVDLLRGASQGDDLTVTSAPTVAFLHEAVARARVDNAVDDDDPHAVAAVAVVEALDPSSEIVAVREILARAAYATVECRGAAAALGLLLDADRLLTDGVGAGA
jgi:hypothetical protein